MNGKSILIIGRGGSGKTGLALEYAESKAEKFLIVVPQITNPRLEEFDSYYFPITTGEELREAYNKSEGPLVLVLAETQKGQPSIWKILREPQFKDLVILADELAVLVSESDDEKEFKVFIRHVRQNNQIFISTTHRIRDDVPPVTPLNVYTIVFVGHLNDEDEIGKLYKVSNVPLDKKTFETRLKNQPPQYNWWDKTPNKGAYFILFSQNLDFKNLP